jgi:protein phosphatase 2C family protein 2/3
MTNQEAVNFVRTGLGKKQDLREICETMMDHCLASETEVGGYGCDNMTVIIVALLHDKTSEQWYDTMATAFAPSETDAQEPNELPQGN